MLELKTRFHITVVTILMAAALLGSVVLLTNQKSAHAQGSNVPSSSAANETKTNTTGKTTATIPTIAKSGEKEFYIFTTEVPDVNETKLKVAGDSYSLTTMIVNKGDKVTVHFYNVDPVKTERHSFTIGAPYNIDKDLGNGESAVATFTADQIGVFQYYCKYHLPVMTGQLQVVP